MRMMGLTRKLFWTVVALGLALASGSALAEVQPEAGGIDYPKDISTWGYRIDWLIDITMIFTVILFAIMCAWMFISYVWHDERNEAEYDHGDSKHHIIVALTLSAVIFLIVDGNLWWNSVVDLDEEIWNFGKVTANEDTVRIEVNARQWAWQARYAGADGEFATPDDVTTLNTIPVPVDTPILVHLASPDVIHSFYLPNLRQKMDAVPGVINPLWFQATETGDYDLACAQHCGTHHYKMKGMLRVLSRDDYAAWSKQASVNALRAYDENDTGAHWGWPWREDVNW